MMLASLSSFCQYPTVKTLGKDTVVIMTLKQGEEINKKFSTLNDSILLLNKQISLSSDSLKSTVNQKVKLSFDLSQTTDSLNFSNLEVKRLNQLLIKKEKEFWNEKKNWAGWMFFSVAITVMVAALK